MFLSSSKWRLRAYDLMVDRSVQLLVRILESMLEMVSDGRVCTQVLVLQSEPLFQRWTEDGFELFETSSALLSLGLTGDLMGATLLWRLETSAEKYFSSSESLRYDLQTEAQFETPLLLSFWHGFLESLVDAVL